MYVTFVCSHLTHHQKILLSHKLQTETLGKKTKASTHFILLFLRLFLNYFLLGNGVRKIRSNRSGPFLEEFYCSMILFGKCVDCRIAKTRKVSIMMFFWYLKWPCSWSLWPWEPAINTKDELWEGSHVLGPSDYALHSIYIRSEMRTTDSMISKREVSVPVMDNPVVFCVNRGLLCTSQ